MKPYALIVALFFLFVLTAPPPVQADSTPLLASQKGVSRTYRFTYSDENTTTLFPERIGQKGGASTFMSTLAFDGDLRVRDYGTVGPDRVYSLSFDEVRTSRFAMNGHTVFDRPDQFIRKYRKNEVFVCVDANHEITRFLFPPGTPQVFKTFMVTAAQEIQVSVREGRKTWSTRETNQHGRGEVDYRVDRLTGNRIELMRTRKNYDYPGLIDPRDQQNIRGGDRIVLNRGGFIEEIDRKEHATVRSPENGRTVLDVKKTVSLRMTGQERFDTGGFGEGRMASMVQSLPGQQVSDPVQNRELLAARVSGLTYEDIERWISRFKPDPKDNRANNAMFHRSSGFVQLHPRSASRLAEFGRKKARSSGERTLVLNILAATGTVGAQDAMRDMLADPLVRNDPQYGVLIQNFSFMDTNPTSKTLRFLSGLMNNRSGFESYAAAHAFGAGIHKLYTRGEKERALDLNRQIRWKIKGATTENERAEYIAAMGNAGMFENNGILFSYLRHPEPRIRAEAAMALRKTETAGSRKQLLGMFADPDRDVQRSAIQTAMQYNPDPAGMKQIRRHLKDGRIQEACYYDLASLMKKNMASHPGLVKDCLKLMVKKKLKDPDLEARIRGMIGP